MPGVRLERLKTASWSSRRFRPCKNILVKVPSFSELGTKHRKNHPRTAGLMPGARDSCHGFESLKIQLGKPNPKPWPQHPHVMGLLTIQSWRPVQGLAALQGPGRTRDAGACRRGGPGNESAVLLLSLTRISRAIYIDMPQTFLSR